MMDSVQLTSRRRVNLWAIVGIRPDGTRLVISNHHARDVAETALRLIQNRSAFSELRIERARRYGSVR